MKEFGSRKASLRQKRALRVRSKLHGTSARPRLCVNKSNLHLSAQLIDDDNGVTLVGISTASKSLRGSEFGRIGKASARKLGTLVAEAAKERGIEAVVFDRGWAKYHGIIAELADSAREAGLQF